MSPLSALWKAARERWPTFALGEAAFERHVLGRRTVELERLSGPDLYLAAACLAREPAALEAFDRECLAPLARQVTSRGVSVAVAEETVQRLRVRLLVGEDGAAPKLGEYDGRGPLVAWVRVAAVRAASNVRRDDANRAELAQQAEPPVAALDPELALIQRKYGAVFQAAVHDAFAALEEEERNALRLSYAHGLNLEGVARALGISRATAGRRVLSGRERVREETLRLLGDRIRATPTELASLLGVVRSKLELSLGALASTWDPAR